MSPDSFEGGLFSKGCVNQKPMGLLICGFFYGFLYSCMISSNVSPVAEEMMAWSRRLEVSRDLSAAFGEPFDESFGYCLLLCVGHLVS
ncbi:MAG: hypothetical protein E7112_06435 [Bacteroidales bacterium]|nr:hypothetical protein [Bacteroidales bacterium]